MGLVSLLGTLALLSTVHPLAPIALVLLVVPFVYVQVRSSRELWLMAMFNSPAGRRMAYIGHFTAPLDVAKEVRLFGLADYFVQSYRDLARATVYFGEDERPFRHCGINVGGGAEEVSRGVQGKPWE